MAQEERMGEDVDPGVPIEGEDDKMYAAMGVAKTIGTVSLSILAWILRPNSQIDCFHR